MDWNILIKEIGLTGICSGLIVWLIKKLGDNFIEHKFKSYELELQLKAKSEEHQFDLSLENHRNELSIILSKSSKLHDKRLSIIHDMYKHLSKLDRTMNDMTQVARFVSGDKKTDEESENNRILNAQKSYINFEDLFEENRIFFNEKTCTLIDEIIKDYKFSFLDYTANRTFKLPNLDFTSENIKKASIRVREKIPPILKALENQFRELIGVKK